MKIENARLKSVDLDNSEAFERVSNYPYRHSHYYVRNTELFPRVSITLELPPGSDQLLSHELLGRKVTVTFEPGPGEAAYEGPGTHRPRVVLGTLGTGRA